MGGGVLSVAAALDMALLLAGQTETEATLQIGRGGRRAVCAAGPRVRVFVDVDIAGIVVKCAGGRRKEDGRGRPGGIGGVDVECAERAKEGAG